MGVGVWGAGGRPRGCIYYTYLLGKPGHLDSKISGTSLNKTTFDCCATLGIRVIWTT